MVKQFLFVTQLYPSEFDKSVYGIFRRMRLFLDAIGQLTDDLRILIYVNADIGDLDEAARKAEYGLLSYWNIKASVTLARVGVPGKKTVWHHYLAPIFNPSRHLDYEALAGREQIDAFERVLAHRPDAVFFHRIETMSPALLSKRPLPPCFLDVDDIEHVKFFRSIRQGPRRAAKRLYYLQLPALMYLDRLAVKTARRAFVCSRHDQRYLARYLGLTNISVAPNAVEIPAEPSDTPPTQTLLFIGTYSYDPNVMAAEYLIARIWPLIHRRLPEARLLIVGNRHERIPSAAQNPPGVSFTGFVESLSDLYNRTRVVCCPILSGGGTRVKIVEAAAFGKPVVSTRLGAEGLDFNDGREIILEDDPGRFAETCVELLADMARCETLGTAARAAAERLYDRDTVVKTIRQELERDFVADTRRRADSKTPKAD